MLHQKSKMTNFTNIVFLQASKLFCTHRGLSRKLAASKIQFLVNSLKLLTTVTKTSILDVAGDLGTPLAVI